MNLTKNTISTNLMGTTNSPAGDYVTRPGDATHQAYINYKDQQAQRGPNYKDPSNIDNPRNNYATYRYDYFSGSAAKVYFGDIWVDDIISIQYNVSNNKLPIYGYASENFDTVAKGQVIVQGTLAISFKEVGYLNVIDSVLKYEKANAYKLDRNVTDKINTYNPNSGKQEGALLNANFVPDLIRRSETIENVMSVLKSSKINQINGNIVPQDFEDWAEVLEDSIWGNGPSSKSSEGTLDRFKMLRADQFDFDNAGGIQVANKNNYSNALNILMAFGDINDLKAEHTIMVLNDVHFTGQGLLIAPNGDPIAETYNFFARDINQTIVSETFNINPLKFNAGYDTTLASDQDVNNFAKTLTGEDGQATADIKIMSILDGSKWTLVNTVIPGTLNINVNTSSFKQELDKTILQTVSDYYISNTSINRPQQISLQVVITTTNGTQQSYTYILGKNDPIDNTTADYIVMSPDIKYRALNLVQRQDYFQGDDPIVAAKNPVNIEDNLKVNPTNNVPPINISSKQQIVQTIDNSSSIPEGMTVKGNKNTFDKQYTDSKTGQTYKVQSISETDSQLQARLNNDILPTLTNLTTAPVGGSPKYNVNMDTVADVIILESRARNNVISSTGAVGYGQFTPIAMVDNFTNYPDLANSFGIDTTRRDKKGHVILSDADIADTQAILQVDPNLSIEMTTAYVATLHKQHPNWTPEQLYEHYNNYGTAEGAASRQSMMNLRVQQTNNTNGANFNLIQSVGEPVMNSIGTKLSNKITKKVDSLTNKINNMGQNTVVSDFFSDIFKSQ